MIPISPKYIIYACVALAIVAGAFFLVSNYNAAIEDAVNSKAAFTKQKIETEVANANLEVMGNEYDKFSERVAAADRIAHAARIRDAETSRELARMLNAAGNTGDFVALNDRLCKALGVIQGQPLEDCGKVDATAAAPGDGAGFIPFATIDRETAHAIAMNLDRIAAYIEAVELNRSIANAD